MLRYLSIIVLCLVISLSACSRNETPVPAVEGKQAPDFTLSDLSGKKTRLSDLKGTVVLVNFWATWCPPCREEIPSMAALNRIMAGKPFRMLAISIDQGGKVPSPIISIGTGLPCPRFSTVTERWEIYTA